MRQLTNEFSDLGADLRTPRLFRLPSPVKAKTLPVPFDYRLWLNDQQDRSPAFPQSGQPCPEDAVAVSKLWTFAVLLQYSQLLSKSQVFGHQTCPTLDYGLEECADYPADAQCCPPYSRSGGQIVRQNTGVFKNWTLLPDQHDALVEYHRLRIFMIFHIVPNAPPPSVLCQGLSPILVPVIHQTECTNLILEHAKGSPTFNGTVEYPGFILILN